MKEGGVGKLAGSYRAAHGSERVEKGSNTACFTVLFVVPPLGGFYNRLPCNNFALKPALRRNYKQSVVYTAVNIFNTLAACAALYA